MKPTAGAILTAGKAMLARLMCIFICLLMLGAISSPPMSAEIPLLFSRYSGTITWLANGGRQQVHLHIASERAAKAEGLLTVHAQERYEVGGGRCRTIAVNLTVDLKSGRVVLVRGPAANDRAEDTDAADPLVGIFAPDFRTFINNHSDPEANQAVDFFFVATGVRRRAPDRSRSKWSGWSSVGSNEEC